MFITKETIDNWFHHVSYYFVNQYMSQKQTKHRNIKINIYNDFGNDRLRKTDNPIHDAFRKHVYGTCILKKGTEVCERMALGSKVDNPEIVFFCYISTWRRLHG